MKKLTIPLATTMLISASVFGEENNNPWNEGFYAGLKSGRTKVNAQGVDSSYPMGIVLGYDFGGFAMEFERVQTRGDVTFFGSNADVDYKLDTTALYAVYRTPGNFYLKLRGGYLYEDVTIKASTTVLSASVTEDDDGFSAGIGAGLRDENYLVEFEFTRIEEDVNYLTFSFSYGF